MRNHVILDDAIATAVQYSTSADAGHGACTQSNSAYIVYTHIANTAIALQLGHVQGRGASMLV